MRTVRGWESLVVRQVPRGPLVLQARMAFRSMYAGIKTATVSPTGWRYWLAVIPQMRPATRRTSIKTGYPMHFAVRPAIRELPALSGMLAPLGQLGRKAPAVRRGLEV